MSWEGRFGSKVGQIGPEWDKSGAFLDQISVHLARGAKCTEIWSEKNPDLSHLGPNWPNLGAKFDIPELYVTKNSLRMFAPKLYSCTEIWP